MKLFDADWVREAAQRIHDDAVFQKRAKGFNVIYQYVVKPVAALGQTDEVRFAIKYPEAEQVWMGNAEKPDFVMTTSYQVLHDILTGKTNAVLALTSRKAFVSGSLTTLLRYTGAINRVVEIFQSIPADADGGLASIGR